MFEKKSNIYKIPKSERIEYLKKYSIYHNKESSLTDMERNKNLNSLPSLEELYLFSKNDLTNEEIGEKSSEETKNSSSSSHQQPLNICIVSDFFLPRLGGVELHQYQIGQALLSRGHKVIIVTGSYGTDMQRQGIRYLTNGLKVYYCPVTPFHNQVMFPTLLTFLRMFRSILLREKIDIVHGHQTTSPMAHQCLMYAKCFPHIRTIYTDHSLFNFASLASVNVNKVFRFTLGTLDHVIAVSHTLRENVVLRSKLDAKKVSVIPNALDHTRFTPFDDNSSFEDDDDSDLDNDYNFSNITDSVDIDYLYCLDFVNRDVDLCQAHNTLSVIGNNASDPELTSQNNECIVKGGVVSINNVFDRLNSSNPLNLSKNNLKTEPQPELETSKTNNHLSNVGEESNNDSLHLETIKSNHPSEHNLPEESSSIECNVSSIIEKTTKPNKLRENHNQTQQTSTSTSFSEETEVEMVLLVDCVKHKQSYTFPNVISRPEYIKDQTWDKLRVLSTDGYCACGFNVLQSSPNTQNTLNSNDSQPNSQIPFKSKYNFEDKSQFEFESNSQSNSDCKTECNSQSISESDSSNLPMCLCVDDEGWFLSYKRLIYTQLLHLNLVTEGRYENHTDTDGTCVNNQHQDNDADSNIDNNSENDLHSNTSIISDTISIENSENCSADEDIQTTPDNTLTNTSKSLSNTPPQTDTHKTDTTPSIHLPKTHILPSQNHKENENISKTHIPNAESTSNSQFSPNKVKSLGNTDKKIVLISPSDLRPPALSTIRIVIVSRLVYRKGLDLLLPLLPLICVRHPNVEFVIGGDGPHRYKIEDVIQLHNLHDRVILLGEVPHHQVMSVMKSGHVFLNTSLTEAFCIAILEAVSCGLTVVSTRIGGVPEILPPSVVHFADPSVLSLALTLDSLLTHHCVLCVNKSDYHALVAKSYCWHNIAKRTEIIYHNTLSEPDRSLGKHINMYLQMGGVAGPLWACVIAIVGLLCIILNYFEPISSIHTVPTHNPEKKYDLYMELKKSVQTPCKSKSKII